MLSNWKRALAAGMLVIIPATMVVPGVAMAKQKDKADEKEKTQKTQKQHKFKDMEKHWAYTDVEKFCDEEIITGYEDGTFKPEKKVTTLEAVVMAVRALDLTDEAKEHMDESLPFKDAAAIPAWARGYVSVALDEGLIDAEEVFHPYKLITRMDATVLLVRALDNLSDLETVDAKLKFVDTLDLNPKFKEYIAQAVMNNLITGYEDKTFRPQKHVTRAEMVTLFARLLDANPIEDDQTLIKGFLKEVDLEDSVIKVKIIGSNNNTRTREFQVPDSADIYRNKERADLEDLKEGDQLEIRLNDDNDIIYISANSTDKHKFLKEVKGVLTDIDTSAETITVNLSNLLEVKFPVAEDVKIIRDGREVSLSRLEDYDRVVLLQDQNGFITQITATDDKRDIIAFE